MWGYAVFLAMVWFSGNTGLYNSLVAAGAPCVVYYPKQQEQPATPPPVCWYDPSNTNYYVAREVYQ